MPEFYMIFALKMPKFYVIIARKIFCRFFCGCSPPVSYAYGFDAGFVPCKFHSSGTTVKEQSQVK